MRCMLSAESAELLVLHPAGVFGFVLVLVVVLSFANLAGKYDHISHFMLHSFISTCLLADLNC